MAWQDKKHEYFKWGRKSRRTTGCMLHRIHAHWILASAAAGEWRIDCFLVMRWLYDVRKNLFTSTTFPCFFRSLTSLFSLFVVWAFSSNKVFVWGHLVEVVYVFLALTRAQLLQQPLIIPSTWSYLLSFSAKLCICNVSCRAKKYSHNLLPRGALVVNVIHLVYI